MHPIYPYELYEDPPGFYISFPDVPGALTSDATEADTKAGALDCLITALEGCIRLRKEIPLPSQPEDGQDTIILPPLIAAKLALYNEMITLKITNVAMADKLGVSETVIRRMLDLRHRSHIGHVENALAILGKRLLVSVQNAA